MTNHPGMRAALLASASTLVLMATACSANSTTASGNQPGTSASPAASAAAAEGGIGGAGDTGSGNGNGGSTTNSPTPRSSTSQAPGPKIVSFTVTQKPACPATAPGFTAPGQDVILSWKVTGATKVALSVDGPGIYRDTYKLEDSDQLGFGCDTSQPQSKHTYLLTATGNGKTATQSLTVTAPSNP